MNILKYTREQLQQFVRDGVADVEVVRNWEIAEAKKRGERVQNIAYDQNLHRSQVKRILDKLEGKKLM
jgi:hypothetical protein